MAKIILSSIVVLFSFFSSAQECTKNMKKFEEKMAAISRARSCVKTESWETCKYSMGLLSLGVPLTAQALKTAGGAIRNSLFQICMMGENRLPENKFEFFAQISAPFAFAGCITSGQYRKQVITQLADDLRRLIEEQRSRVLKYGTGNSHWDYDIKVLGHHNDAVIKARVAKDFKEAERLSKILSSFESGIIDKYLKANSGKPVPEALRHIEEYNKGRANVSSWSQELEELEDAARRGISEEDFLKLLRNMEPSSVRAEGIIAAELRNLAGTGMNRSTLIVPKGVKLIANSRLVKVFAGAGGTIITAGVSATPNKCTVGADLLPAVIVDPDTCAMKTDFDKETEEMLDWPIEKTAEWLKKYPGACGFFDKYYEKHYGVKREGACGENSVTLKKGDELFQVSVDSTGKIEKIVRDERGQVSTAIFENNEISKVLRKTGTTFAKSQTYQYDVFNDLRASIQENISCCFSTSNRPSQEECDRYAGYKSAKESGPARPVK